MPRSGGSAPPRPWRRSLAVAAGASIALLALNIEYNASNVIAVLNPLEKMLTFADASTSDAASGSNPSAVSCCCSTGSPPCSRATPFVLHSSPRPTVFLIWLIVPGIVWAWRRGERLAALQALVLLLAAIGIDALGVRRGLKSEYFIFTDPLIMLAGAILLDRCAICAFTDGPIRSARPCSACISPSARPSPSNTPSSAAGRNRSANGAGITFR